MHARVARWEGADEDSMRATAEQINSASSSGPPEGLPAKGIMMLIDPESGRSMVVTLFESEADMRQGDEKLNSMSPARDGMGRRSAVEMYEVTVDLRV
jgi:hypothetical protein